MSQGAELVGGRPINPIEDAWILEAECSVTGADAVELAHMIVDGSSSVTGGFYIAGDESTYVHGLHARKINLAISVDLDDGRYKLAMIQPLNEEDRWIKYKRNWRYKKVMAPPEVPRKDGDPFLAIMLDDSGYALLPIAGFARRETGTCRYVQLGAEMDDDNYFVTLLDDNTSRLKYVEALQDLLTEAIYGSPYNRNLRLDSKNLKLIERLAQNELTRNKTESLDAIAAHLVRLAGFKLLHTKETVDLKIAHNGEFDRQSTTIAKVMQRTRLDDGRIVQLALGQVKGSQYNQDPIQLLAITRGEIALPLATLNPTTGEITFDQESDAPDLERREAQVQELTKIFQNISKKIWDNSPWQGRNYWQRYQPHNQGYVVSEVGIKRGLLNAQQFHIPQKEQDAVPKGKSNYAKYLKSRQYQIDKSRIEEYFDEPDEERRPPFETEIVEHADTTKAKLRKRTEQLATVFGVKEMFEKYLGETNPNAESLIEKIVKMRSRRSMFAGVIGGVTLGKSTTNMYGTAEVDRDGDVYRLRIATRQNSTPDIPLKPTVDELFDISKPLQPNKIHLKEVAAWAGSILKILKDLEPVEQKD